LPRELPLLGGVLAKLLLRVRCLRRVLRCLGGSGQAKQNVTGVHGESIYIDVKGYI
jgi:hypothetical protein